MIAFILQPTPPVAFVWFIILCALGIATMFGCLFWLMGVVNDEERQQRAAFEARYSTDLSEPPLRLDRGEGRGEVSNSCPHSQSRPVESSPSSVDASPAGPGVSGLSRTTQP